MTGRELDGEGPSAAALDRVASTSEARVIGRAWT